MRKKSNVGCKCGLTDGSWRKRGHDGAAEGSMWLAGKEGPDQMPGVGVTAKAGRLLGSCCRGSKDRI